MKKIKDFSCGVEPAKDEKEKKSTNDNLIIDKKQRENDIKFMTNVNHPKIFECKTNNCSLIPPIKIKEIFPSKEINVKFNFSSEDIEINKLSSYYLTKNEKESLCGIIYDEIQTCLKKGQNKDEIFQRFLCDKARTIEIAKDFMLKLKININKHSLDQAINCLIVISHAFLKSDYYEKLVKDVKNFNKISRNSAKKHVLNYIKALDQKKNIDLRNWLPEKRHTPTLEETRYWIELLKKYGNIQEVRRILEKEKKYVPQARTLSKYIIKSTDYDKFQNLLNKKVDWIERTPYKDLQELAKRIGKEATGVEGKLITPEIEYNNVPYPDEAFLEWYCGRCLAIFKQTPHQVKKGSWCEKCVKELQRLEMIIPIEKLREAARIIGIEKTGYEGKFLTDEEEYYKKRDTPPIHTFFWWECGKCNFRWQATPDKVLNRRQWCPNCSQGFYERICRGCMEHIFSYLMKKEVHFPQTSLDQVLISSSGINALKDYDPKFVGFHISNMHLDGYNQELKVGFERNGEQHYMRVLEWHPNEGDFENQLKIDSFKKKLCKDNGILLIIVGFEMYNGKWCRIEPEEMQDYIVRQIEFNTRKKLPEIPKFNYKKYISETINQKVDNNSTNIQKFSYLTEIQRKILIEFKNGNLFVSDLLQMPHLKDLKYIHSTVRDLFEKGYLSRIYVLNTNATGTRTEQYKYSITNLGNEIIELLLD